MTLARLGIISVLALVGAPAHAIDHPMEAKKLLLKPAKVVWVAKSPPPAMPIQSPTGIGAELRVMGDAQDVTVPLAASLWSLNGAFTVLKFKNTLAPFGGTPVRIALIRTGALVKVVAKTSIIDVMTSVPSSVTIELSIGNDHYCSTCSTNLTTRPETYLAKECAAPIVCPSGGGASTTSSTLESTTTSTSTSTTTSSTIAGFLVFEVNDNLMPNEIGGLSGADSICNAEALAAGLPGTYVAWMSTTSVNAKDRLTPGSGPFLLAFGRSLVANDIADLTDGTIATSLEFTANGTHYLGIGWTATAADGTYNGTGDCAGWTSATGQTTTGISTATNSQWTNDNPNTPCNSPPGFTLYCFQL